MTADIAAAPLISPQILDAFDEAVLILDSIYRAEDSFYEFVKQAWPHVDGKPFCDGWVVKAICDHLEEVYYGRITNLLINIPPRHGKSLLINVMFTVWVWIKDSSTKFLCVSYADWLAIRDHVKARRLIRSEWFQRRWGTKVMLAEDQDTKKRVDTTNGGMRQIGSVDGGITGEGGDINIIDDPNNVNNRSAIALQSALDWFTGVLATRFSDPKSFRKIVVQQRCSELDISGHIISNEAEDWVCLILPFEYESDRECVTVPVGGSATPWRDPRMDDGEILWKERFRPEDLKRLKKAMASEVEIAGQLQQRPAPAEGSIIKRPWFQIWASKSPPKMLFSLQAWDTATSMKKTSAYSAQTTWGVFNEGEVPNIVLLGSWRDRVEFPQLYHTVKYMGSDWRVKEVSKPENEWVPDINPDGKHAPDVILIEDKSSGTQLLQTIRKLNFGNTMLLPFNPNKFGDKMERVRAVSHIIEAGRVWVPGQPPNFLIPRPMAKMVLDMCAMFPNGASRDVVDTVSMALLWLIKRNWVYHPMDAIDFSPEQKHNADDNDRQALY